MIRPRPWHEKALALRAEGAVIGAISEACGVSTTQVWRFLDPEYRARQRAAQDRSYERRLATDPVFREKMKVKNRAYNKTARMRRDARAEAADTGRRYEDVCAAWDIAP